METLYSWADPSKSAQAGMGVITRLRLSVCVSDWIPLESRVCMLKLKVLYRSLSILQAVAILKVTILAEKSTSISNNSAPVRDASPPPA